MGQGLCRQILLFCKRKRKCSRAATALRLPSQAGCGRGKGGAVVAGGPLWGAGTWKKTGFCHCRHLSSDFLGLRRPRAPSGQRGADAHIGVHKRELWCASHAASITDKRYFPTLQEVSPTAPSRTAELSQVCYPGTQSRRVLAQ